MYNGVLPLEQIFTPAEFSVEVLLWALSLAKAPSHVVNAPWQFCCDLDDWSHCDRLDSNTCWVFSPHFGRQCMLQVMYAWTELPCNSADLFVFSRVMQHDFGCISKFISKVGESWLIPLLFVPVVPFIVYYLPPFNRISSFLSKSDKQDCRLDAAAKNWIIGWMQLPLPMPPSGLRNKWELCSSCDCSTVGFTLVHQCLFASSGFSCGSTTDLLCGVVYHAPCIQVDAPFTSCLSSGRGLQYPPLLVGLPFICELCSV